MIDQKEHRECSGCGACAEICNQRAIAMQADTLGFMYPRVDLDKCTNCGLCVKKCPFGDEPIVLQPYPKFYVTRHKDLMEVKKSQSGAAFIAIADYVIEQGGIVYGVGYNDHFVVAHKRATTKEETQEFRGSKYVQSNLDGVFAQIKADLRNGNLVLFVGTPCQVAGLKACTTNKEQQTLLLVDLICHGVPSPQIWEEYLCDLEKRKRDKLVKVIFRDKEEYGWTRAKTSYVFSKRPNHKVHVLGAFNREVLFRESCSNCIFCSTNRAGDITIGDFWGNKSRVNWSDADLGLSTLITNTDKGERWLHSISPKLELCLINREDALQYNLRCATPEHPHRRDFELAYEQEGFYAAMKKYHDFGWKKRIRMFCGEIKRWLKRV